MNADFLAVMEFWEREKGISRDVLLAAVQESLVSAAKKAIGPARELRVQIDPKSGDIKAFAKLIVSEKVLAKHDQISLFDARRLKADAQLGEELEIEVTPTGFGRIASQYARQALMQQIRKAEKAKILVDFKDRIGDIVSGVVRRFDRSDVTIDLGKYEAMLPNRERVPTEEYQIGERIRCYVKAVEDGAHGPEIILSRSDPHFVIKLFRLEVGACVGLRGQRVKNIVRELNNEKVDIIKWDPNIKVYLANALAPAKLKSFEVDEARHRVRIQTVPDQLSLAIGKRGQNARLTSRLTGWQVDIEAEATTNTAFETKVAEAVQSIAAIPGITPAQADALVHHGFLSLEDLLQVEPSDLADIPEISAQAGAILEAARTEVSRRTVLVGEPPTA